MRHYLEPILRRAVERIGGTEFQLGPPGGGGRADVSTSVALKVARELGGSPIDIAERIVAALEIDPLYIERVEIAAPGFINFHFTPYFFQTRLAEVLDPRERYGHAGVSPTFRAAVAAFEVDRSREGTEDDPLRAVRYAREGIAGLLRHAAREGLTPSPDVSLDPLRAPEELDLIRTIILYPEHAGRAAALADPDILTSYLHDLADAFNSFNQAHRTLSAPPALCAARLRLLTGAGIILDNALSLMGLTAPNIP